VTAYLLAALAFIGGLGMTAIGDMVSEEVRDRLDHLPHAILRVAARRLDPALRVTVYEDEWLPELTYILKGDEARPVTRLIHGTRYAVGILMSVRRITRYLHPSVPKGLRASLLILKIFGMIPRTLFSSDRKRVNEVFKEIERLSSERSG
jgi:hypothetical protein